jgi:hypothetical protein
MVSDRNFQVLSDRRSPPATVDLAWAEPAKSTARQVTPIGGLVATAQRFIAVGGSDHDLSPMVISRDRRANFCDQPVGIAAGPVRFRLADIRQRRKMVLLRLIK